LATATQIDTWRRLFRLGAGLHYCGDLVLASGRIRLARSWFIHQPRACIGMDLGSLRRDSPRYGSTCPVAARIWA